MSIFRFTNSEVRQILRNSKSRTKKAGLEFILSPKPVTNSKSRILVIISRKHALSTKRNLFRRRCKDAFIKLDLLSKNLDYIILVKNKSALELNFEQIKLLLKEFSN